LIKIKSWLHGIAISA